MEQPFFECQRCTNCCRRPGSVRLTETDIIRIAEFFAVNEFEFVQHFTELATNRQYLVLRERNNHSCIFLDGADCLIQPVKPIQCASFP
ncbi:MAG: YkgJ family cysteine cluster protein, partial [Verrucomicrobia bacterium]|nr:YkgJ family cysteine cluster protein [Verrucomicrobiota bacterium]